jgi:type III restriction enzyme
MVVLMKKADLVFENNSVKAVYNSTSIGEKVVNNVPIGNIIERIADETELTKTTVLEVLKRTKSLKYIKRNPEEYIRAVITIINAKKLELILNKGLEYTETGEEWKLDIFNDIEVANSSTLEVENSAFSHVIFDSDGESEYAKNLDSSARVKNFVKLPSKFKVPTPLGAYNPDWGIVATTDEKEDRLLLIRETKFGKENDSPQNVLNNLRNDEKEKIAAAKKHFSLLNVDYKASTKTDLTDTF